MEQFNLDGKAGYIMTGNVANMLKAFVKFPGEEADSKSDENYDEDEDVYMPADSQDVLDYLPKGISCFIHTTVSST